MNGLILLDKPEGVTSFSAVAAVRRMFGEKKAGHTGTLDPMATGVLPVLLGSATRLSDYLLSADKSYIASMRLGITTDTLDRTGTVLSEHDVHIAEKDFLNVMHRFCGEIMQIPPMYSAIKQNGQPLYKLARQGIETVRAARPVTIYEIKVLEHTAPEDFTVFVRCSKGTYIRTLCADIGAALGCGAILTALRRTGAAGFSDADCVTLQQLKENPHAFLQPPLRAVAHLPFVSVSEKQAVRFQNGGALDLNRLCGTFPRTGEPVRVMYGAELLGIGAVHTETNALRINCVLAK